MKVRRVGRDAGRAECAEELALNDVVTDLEVLVDRVEVHVRGERAVIVLDAHEATAHAVAAIEAALDADEHATRHCDDRLTTWALEIHSAVTATAVAPIDAMAKRAEVTVRIHRNVLLGAGDRMNPLAERRIALVELHRDDRNRVGRFIALCGRRLDRRLFSHRTRASQRDGLGRDRVLERRRRNEMLAGPALPRDHDRKDRAHADSCCDPARLTHGRSCDHDRERDGFGGLDDGRHLRLVPAGDVPQLDTLSGDARPTL